jgi:2-polyprenyl-3-methyl-5-hydroxy-6-metoxy-1,4-benzoquinol methylase
VESVVCALCGSSDSREVIIAPDIQMNRPEVTSRLVRCRNCGLVYQNPRPSAGELDAHYPDDYELYRPPPKQGRSARLLSLAYAWGMRKRTGFVTRAMPGGRLLDVGCGAGIFLEAMQALPGWSVEGVELKQSVAEQVNQRLGIPVFPGTLESANFPDESFDAVTLWDVLEHVLDAPETLGQIARILRPGGVFVARVPNWASFDRSLFGQAWAGYDAPRHTYVFSQRTLSMLMEKQGLEVTEISGNIGNYVTFALSAKYWMALRGVEPRRRERISRFLFSPAMRVASAPFFLLPSKLVRGPVLVMTARKPAVV